MPEATAVEVDLLHEADLAVKYVGAQMDIGAANRPGDVISSGGVSLLCVADMRTKLGEAGLLSGPVSEVVATRAVWALAYGCGNCGEQSAIAFMYLFKKGIRPLEWMRFNAPDDHAFVVLGRAWDKSFDWDVPHWGPKAVVCDPWKRKAYPAIELKSLWPGAVPTIWYRVT